MAQGKLDGMRVAILATDGFEQSELLESRKALQQAGAITEVVSPKSGRIRGWNHTEWGQEVGVDKSLEEADPEEYDALVLPGGVMNPDKLRAIPAAVSFAK
jgi:protease I